MGKQEISRGDIMRRLSKIIIVVFFCMFLTSCNSSEQDIVGRWYCNENNVLLTFYTDNTFERELFGFSSELNGKYQWDIDNSKMLTVSDTSKEILITLNWSTDISTAQEWSLNNNILIIGNNTYTNVDDKEITAQDISDEFIDRNPVSCSVFFESDTSRNDTIQQIEETIDSENEVIEIRYVSAEESWEEFQEEYFGDSPELAEGFKDNNPLAESDYLQIYTCTESGLDEIVSSIQNINGVREINSSVPQIEDETLF